MKQDKETLQFQLYLKRKHNIRIIYKRLVDTKDVASTYHRIMSIDEDGRIDIPSMDGRAP